MQDSFDRSAGQAPGLKQQVRELIDYDDARDSAPQEHAATLLGAGAFALCALRAQSRLGAVLHAMLAGALLFRAASGRDGLRVRRRRFGVVFAGHDQRRAGDARQNIHRVMPRDQPGGQF